MDERTLDEALTALGALLEEQEEHHTFLAVGGGTLLLLGLIDRPTADLDLVGTVTEAGYAKLDSLPPSVSEAARHVGAAFGLQPDWVNTGPAGLLDSGCPPAWPTAYTAVGTADWSCICPTVDHAP